MLYVLLYQSDMKDRVLGATAIEPGRRKARQESSQPCIWKDRANISFVRRLWLKMDRNIVRSAGVARFVSARVSDVVRLAYTGMFSLDGMKW